ncbi:hemagglutinin repeat-containing protein, partial [Leptotrichia hongkongensis]|uniref:hemagglutinin repeat-containing protein n=1 Tax=Leptotrichia hongkongensis TaxID=554406 RepID=UPI0035A89A62
GDVKYGARIDTRDVHTSSKSSGFTISAGINSPALDRAKQVGQAVSQIKNGDTAGGAMEAVNAATGTIKGLADNQGTRQTNYVNGSVGAKGARDAMANSNFYANIGVNAGFTRSRSNTSSHTEGASVTTLKPMDENSSITYNNVNNITYQGTQAQGGTFIYNNVANIQKEAVELHNSYTSSSSSRGINAGATIGYGHKLQTTGNGGSISASQSNQNTVETVYANGNFKNVNEVHNNTGSMVLNGFNQEGGKVTGNIGKVEVISRQNTSTTTGSSSGISLGISANGVPSSVNINGSRTNGDRAFVDNQSIFIVGEGSSLHVGTLENTGAVVGKQGNSTFKIDSYIGKDIQNHDTMKTTGGSVGISTGKPRITNVGFNQDSRDKQGITRNTIIGDVEIGETSGSPINRDLGKANEVTKDTHSSTNINVESQTIEYVTNPAKLKEDIGKAKDEIEAVGAVAKAAFNTIGSKEKNGFFDFLRTERVQETVRNLGYIDTKGKTKEQIAQEMQDKYGEIFAKNGKKLEINFYVNSEVSQDDPNAKNKMNAAGFVAEDGSIWLNADNISSISNFNLNSVFGHELTHNVTGKDTELLANFGEARASGFIEKAIDKGYLAKVGGGLNWNSETLTKEQKDKLASYEDIEEKLKPMNYLAVDIKRDENGNIISITKDNVLISEIEKAIKNKFDLENFNFPSKILSLDIESKKLLSDEIYKELEIEFKQKLEDYSKSGYKNQILNQLMEKYDISENDINIAIQDVDKYISSLDGQKAIKNDILKRSDIKNNIESILTNSSIDNKSKINKIKDKYGITITEKELKDSKNTIMKVIEYVSLKNIIIQDSNKIANDSRWKSQRFRDFFANNQKLTNMQLVIDEDDFVHYIDSKTKSGRLNNLFETIGDVSFVSGKDIQVEKVAVKIGNQIYQKEIVKIKDDAKPISKFKDEQIINNPKEMFIGNTEYKTGNNSIKEIIDSDKTIFYEPTIGNAQARALDDNAFYNNGKKGSGADTRVEMDFNYTALYKVYGYTDKDGLINIASVTPYASYQVYAHEALGHGAHNQKGENTGSKEFYQVYRDQNKEIHFQGELTGFQVSIENLTPEKIFNNIISDLKNQKITAIDKKNNIVTINPKILNELNNKNSEYYKYLYKEIEEKFREAKQNNNTIINLNLPFSTRKLEEKNTVNLENEILKDQGKKDFLRGVY